MGVKRWKFLVLMLLLLAGTLLAMEGRLLRYPAVSQRYIAFTYAGDLWIVPREGGIARRLTSHPGMEIFPRFSPDGRWIAFTGEIDGNVQVYLIPAEGGEPRRITVMPQSQPTSERMGPDNIVMAWHPDGKRILFRSRWAHFDPFVGQLYLAHIDATPPEMLPLPEGGFATFSPDGKKIAYNRTFREFRTWKRYKGGMQQDVWIYDLEKKKLRRLTRYEGCDHFPMWYKDRIYFVSDRDGRENIYYYDLKTGKITQVTFFKEYDVKFPSLGPDAIVFENGGYIYLLDLKTHRYHKVNIKLPADRLWMRPTLISVVDYIESFGISPDASRAMFVARGDVFTVPAKEGVTYNITRSQGVREKDAVWSPDGRWIAYFSDKTGEYEIYIVDPRGEKKPIRITTDGACFRWGLRWSPDSRKLLYADKNQKLWYVDIEKKKPVLIDSSRYNEFRDYTWSPDSRWVAYTKRLKNRFAVIYIYSLEEKKARPVTENFYNSFNPSFSPDGKYLYFLSNRDFRPTLGNFELNFTYTEMTRIYALPLLATTPSPIALKETEPSKEEKEQKKEKQLRVEIDFKGIISRIVPLPMPAGSYSGLLADRDRLFYFSYKRGKGTDLMVYNLKEKKPQLFLSGIRGAVFTPDLKKVIVRKGKDKFAIVPTKGKPQLKKFLDLSSLKMRLDRRKEYRQMFREAWRLMRDYFYAANMHGIDWKAMYRKYEVLLPYAGCRDDLTYIIGEMIGELHNSHTYVGGGDKGKWQKVNIGTLGAELEPDPRTGRWRIKRILKGQNWIKKYYSPLTEPGNRAYEGEYILAIDGVELRYPDTPYRLLEGKAGKPVVLTVSKDPYGKHARKIVVKPIPYENTLRYYNWVERNRQYVEKASGGKIGYVHIPDMSLEGLNEFVRTYYPQLDKEGLIIDDRYNGGGFVAQMILERLRRILGGLFAPRNAAPETEPPAVFVGHMVCLINRYAASDGDIFPYYFREYGLGPLIGERTWGGTVGIRTIVRLVDGGYVYVPEFALYSKEGKWIIEGHGVEPDFHVENLPQDEIKGRDAQLEFAVKYLLKKIKEEPRRLPPRPKDPVKK